MVLPQVEIVHITPVPAGGVPRDQIPANVQVATDQNLRRLQSLNLADFMGTAIDSVQIGEGQGNPYQLEVNYRGFSASPLLGTPQGLSVFLDGVRVNEPFGDTVNWDLIPRVALADIALLPGSNPLFGLNTLGGALVLQTKSGLTHPGTEVALEGGSFGRRSLDLSHGQSFGAGSGGAHLFLAASSLDERGWRDASPSRVRQLFGRIGQRQGDAHWDLSLVLARNRLVGNGPLPESMLEVRRSQVYTVPDLANNRMTLATLNAGLPVGSEVEVSGTAYLRRSRVATLNGDLNDDYDPPVETYSGVEHRTHSLQRGTGLALQATWKPGAHRFTIGAAYDGSHSDFEQASADGLLDAQRAVVDVEDAAVDARIEGRSRNKSVYAAALLALRPDLQLTLSGRLNDTQVDTVDVGRERLGLDTQLDSSARYRKFNPAAGLTWQATPWLTAYGGYSQGNRAPSPIELGCSDPTQPCVLPNALQSDPPLRQVVSRTVEAGLRGRFGDPALHWNASFWRTANQDDLLFISNGQAAGYFQNVGRTVRRGFEASLSRRGSAFDWSLSYSHLRAVFGAPACLVSEANSSAETSPACAGADEIEVRPGDHLPGLPQHSLKAGFDFAATARWRVGAQLTASSGQFLRGNENNRHQADGESYFGSGRIGGYAVLGLTSSWQLAPHLELFGRISNVLGRRYASAGQLGENAFNAAGVLQPPADWRNEAFVGPGAPRALWIGLRWQSKGL